MQRHFLLIATTIITWVHSSDESLTNQQLTISFWPGVSWESRSLGNSALRRSLVADSDIEKKDMNENEVLNRIRARLRNCFLQPSECQMEPLSEKGAILLQKLQEQLDGGMMDANRVVDHEADVSKRIEMARTFRNYHSHFLYNPLFRLQAFTDMKHKKSGVLNTART